MLDRWIGAAAGLSMPLSRQALDDWRLSRLAEAVSYARAHSAFYRRHLPDGGISSIEDFLRLPFTTPEDLRQHYRQMLCVRPDSVARIVTLTTSGSTGMPKRICFTEADQARTTEYFHHGMAEFVSPGERVLSLLPGSSPGSLNALLRQGLAQMSVTLELFGYPQLEQYPELLRVISERQITALVGPPSVIAAVARFSAEAGLTGLTSSLRSVLLAAEYVSVEARETISRIWNCRVNEHYGMTETGLAGAVGCAAFDGYHVWESGLFYEIIDPASGLPVEDGHVGEIVVTTLLQEAMPMIRYRTEDRSRILPGQCPCGSVLKRLERVWSRPQKKKFRERTIPNEF